MLCLQNCTFKNSWMLTFRKDIRKLLIAVLLTVELMRKYSLKFENCVSFASDGARKVILRTTAALQIFNIKAMRPLWELCSNFIPFFAVMAKFSRASFELRPNSETEAYCPFWLKTCTKKLLINWIPVFKEVHGYIPLHSLQYYAYFLIYLNFLLYFLSGNGNVAL